MKDFILNTNNPCKITRSIKFKAVVRQQTHPKRILSHY
jgi:hypothetical protein